MKLSNHNIQGSTNQFNSQQNFSHQQNLQSTANRQGNQQRQIEEEHFQTSEAYLSMENPRKLQKNSQIMSSQSPNSNKSHLFMNQNENTVQSFRERTQCQQQQALLINQNTKVTPPRNIAINNLHNLKTIPSPKNQTPSTSSTQKYKVASSQNIQKNHQQMQQQQVGSPLKKMNEIRKKVTGKNLQQQIKVNDISHSESQLQNQQFPSQGQLSQQQKYIQQIQQIAQQSQQLQQYQQQQLQQQQHTLNSPPTPQEQKMQKNNSSVKIQNVSTAALKEFVESVNKQKNTVNSNQAKTLQTSFGGNSTKNNNQISSSNNICTTSYSKSKSPSTLKKQYIPLQNGIVSQLLKKSISSTKCSSENVNQQKYQIVIDTNQINNSTQNINSNQSNSQHQPQQISSSGLLSQKNLKKSLTNILSPTSTTSMGMLSVKNRASNSNTNSSNQNILQQLRKSKTNNSVNLYESQRNQKIQCQSMIINSDNQDREQGIILDKNQLHLSQPDLDTLDSEAIAHYTELITQQTKDLKEQQQIKPNKQLINKPKSLKQLDTVFNSNNINRIFVHSNQIQNTDQSFDDKKKSQSQEIRSSRQYTHQALQINEQIQKSQESLNQQFGLGNREQQEINLECSEEFELLQNSDLQSLTNKQPIRLKQNQYLLQSFTESLRSSQDTRRNPLETGSNFHNNSIPIDNRNDYCINHLQKRGKYNVESESLNGSNSNLKSYCSKCAIELVGQGIKVIENETITKKNVIDRFLGNLRNDVNDLLNATLKMIDEKEETLNKYYQNQLKYVNNFYDECINTFNEFREEDLQKMMLSQSKVQEIYNVKRNVIRSHIIDVENMNKDISQNIDQIIYNIKLGPFKEIITQYQDKCNEFLNDCEQSNQIQPTYLKFNNENNSKDIQYLKTILENIREKFYVEQESDTLHHQLNSDLQNDFTIKQEKLGTESAKQSIKKQDQQQLKNQLYVSFENRELFFQAAKIASGKKQPQQEELEKYEIEAINQNLNQQNQQSFKDTQQLKNLCSNNLPFSFQGRISTSHLQQQLQDQLNNPQNDKISNIQSTNVSNIDECNGSLPNPTFGNRVQFQASSQENKVNDQSPHSIRSYVNNHKQMYKNNFQSLSEARLNQIQAEFMYQQSDQLNNPNSQKVPSQFIIPEEKFFKQNTYTLDQFNQQQNIYSPQIQKSHGFKGSQSSGNVLQLMNKSKICQNEEQEQNISNQHPQFFNNEESSTLQFNSAQKNIKNTSNSNLTSGSTFISTSKKQNTIQQNQIQGYLKTDPSHNLSNIDTVNVNSFIDNYNLTSDERKHDQTPSSFTQAPSTSNYFTGQSTSTHKQEMNMAQQYSSTKQQFELNTQQSKNQDLQLHYQSITKYESPQVYQHPSSNSKQEKLLSSQQRQQRNPGNCKPLTLLPSFMNEDDDANRYDQDDSNRAEAASYDRIKDTFRSQTNKQGDFTEDQLSSKYIAYTDNGQDTLRATSQQYNQYESYESKRSPIKPAERTLENQNSQSGSSKRPPAPSPSQKLHHKASPSLTAPFGQYQSAARDQSQNVGPYLDRVQTENSTNKKKKSYDLHLNLSSITIPSQTSVFNHDLNNQSTQQMHCENNLKVQQRINSKSQSHLHANTILSQQQNQNSQIFQSQQNKQDQKQLMSIINDYQKQQLVHQQYSQYQQLQQQQQSFQGTQQQQQQQQTQQLLQNVKRGLLFESLVDEAANTNSQQANQSLQLSETIEKNDVEQNYNCILQMQYPESDHEVYDSQSESILGQAAKYSSSIQSDHEAISQLNKMNQKQVDATFQDSFDKNISVSQIQPNESDQQRFISSPFQKQEQNFADSINSQGQNLSIKSQFFYSPQFREESPNISD